MSLVGMNFWPQGNTMLVAFPQFSLLPQHIQDHIWQLIMEARKPHHVILQDGFKHCQPVPAIAHVCRAAREIAFQNGGIFRLGNGTPTWFNPEKDFIFWDSERNLGQLSSKVQNLIMPFYRDSGFNTLCDIFEDLFEGGIPSSLRSVYIATEQMSESDFWNSYGVANFFGDEPILAPTLNQFDPLIGRVEAVQQWLRHESLARWRRQRMTNFDDSEEWQDHAGEVLHAWIYTSGLFSDAIKDADFDDFENEVLMHPEGGSWWEFFARRGPSIYPTAVFMRLDNATLVTDVDMANY
ncbi:uncharacterized protein F4812DRAFT_461358 [Daldinia caldariorum]|uniref:uncharacterized protein n=1 Tax=Daldinia caldariorum TaxID=326644 RepID=UPI002008E13C|nr:uncharacterized protein F4812DRAFT_461358 [Daldinia caldariorum]KAI1465663.1 hypothetical protein F4812DRAFT_461358 [Daldinia caldariorum]